MLKNNSNTLFTGLFFGALFGFLAAFLFGTKKGKRVLHSITQEGMKSANSLKELLTQELEDEALPERLRKAEIVKNIKKDALRVNKSTNMKKS